MEIDKLHNLKNIDKATIKMVFDHYFKPLCVFGNRYIADVFAVEDLVQEVFIGFWSKRENFDNINTVKAFLYTSVRNKCLNHLKHQSIIQKHEVSLIHELESEQFFTNHIIEEETFNQLYQEIKNLPKAAQEIMILALNGLKNQEIADELNITVNTVKTHKKIAYSKIKEQLRPIFVALFMSL